MKIVLYCKHLQKTSGITTFQIEFLKQFHFNYEIIVVYDIADNEVMERFEKYCQVVKNKMQLIECDICIYSSVFRENHNIIAKKYVQVIHSNLHEFKVPYSSKGVDIHVSVSESVRDELKKHYNIDSIVIENMLSQIKTNKVLRLATMSRIAQKKGFERIVKFAKELKKENIPFIWGIYGNEITKGYLEGIKIQLKDIPEVVFLGHKDNVHDYVIDSDYIVQLSDSEGYCYSVYEALSLGIPVIVTRWENIENLIKDGVNGYILNMDMSNLNVKKYFTNIPKIDSIVNNSLQIDKWTNLIFK